MANRKLTPSNYKFGIPELRPWWGFCFDTESEAENTREVDMSGDAEGSGNGNGEGKEERRMSLMSSMFAMMDEEFEREMRGELVNGMCALFSFLFWFGFCDRCGGEWEGGDVYSYWLYSRLLSSLLLMPPLSSYCHRNENVLSSMSYKNGQRG